MGVSEPSGCRSNPATVFVPAVLSFTYTWPTAGGPNGSPGGPGGGAGGPGGSAGGPNGGAGGPGGDASATPVKVAPKTTSAASATSRTCFMSDLRVGAGG